MPATLGLEEVLFAARIRYLLFVGGQVSTADWGWGRDREEENFHANPHCFSQEALRHDTRLSVRRHDILLLSDHQVTTSNRFVAETTYL